MYEETNNHYGDDNTQILLDRIIEETGSLGAFLVDESGFMIAESGPIEIDRVALSALISATFGATGEVAKILGEPDFSRLTHHGINKNLYIGKAGSSHILLIVFGSDTNLGLVKLYAEQFSQRLGKAIERENGNYIEDYLRNSNFSSIGDDDEDITDIL